MTEVARKPGSSFQSDFIGFFGSELLGRAQSSFECPLQALNSSRSRGAVQGMLRGHKIEKIEYLRGNLLGKIRSHCLELLRL